MAEPRTEQAAADFLEGRAAELTDEALRLRHQPEGSVEESPRALHVRLLKARANLDRVEEILTQLIRAHAKAEQARADAQAELDDAWARASEGRLTSTSEYMTGRERNAQVDLKTVGQTIALRRAEKAERTLRTALEVTRLAHRGLESVRRDLDTRIRLLTLDTQLER